MSINRVTYDNENPQPEGVYWCLRCNKPRHHSFYSPRDNDFYEHASDEELDEVANEPDILRCDICVKLLENELTGAEHEIP